MRISTLLMPPPAWTRPAPASSSDPVDRVELSCCSSEPGLTWGATGHEIVNSVAADHMPDAMPPFFRDAKDRLTALAAHPDRLKFRSLRHLNQSSVDHYMNLELLQGQELPSNRYAYATAVTQRAGTLPYRIAESYEHLVAEFTLYRRELALRGQDSPLVKQCQENAIHVAGMLGHYIADATQPLHATVHHDGWDEEKEPNPDGFRTRPGLHSQFETRLVNRWIDREQVSSRVSATKRWEGDPLEWGHQLVLESNGLVRHLYQLEKDGKMEVANPGPEALELATARLARGAEVLRDLWHSAWEQSAELAVKEP